MANNVVLGGGTTTGLEVVSGKGVWLTTKNGERLIDCTSQSWLYNLGFAHPDIVRAIEHYSRDLTHIHPGIDSSVRNQLADRLCSLFPATAAGCSFSPTGALAIEAALKLAHLTNGRTTFASLFDAFHGTSIGTINLGWATSKSRGDWTAGAQFSALANNMLKTPNCYCYRCYFKKEPSTCNLECANWFELLIQKATAGEISALILEPVQGSGGQIIARREYLTALREICDSYGIILIFDESQTFCRIGHYSAAEYFGVSPDISVVSKSLGAGLPVAATLLSPKITPFVPDQQDFHTFSNNALAQRLAMVHLDVIEREQLLKNTRIQGERIASLIEQNNSSHVGDIRQLGLHIGIELVLDPQEKSRWTRDQISAFREFCRARGILLGAGGSNFNVIKIKPPLIINDDEAALVAATFNSALNEFTAAMS